MMPTREEIESMSANEMMDAAVWMYVFKGGTFTGKLPKFSSDIAVAWEVVEKLNSYSYWISISNNFMNLEKINWLKGGFLCEYSTGWDEEIDYVIAETAPLAICRAALLAVQSASPTHDLP